MENLFEELATPETVTQATERLQWLKGEIYNTLWWLFANNTWERQGDNASSWSGYFKLLDLPKEMEQWPLQEEKLQGLSEYDKSHLKKNQIEALSEYKPQFRKQVLAKARRESSINAYTGRKQLTARDITVAGSKIFPKVVDNQRGYLRFDGNKVQLKNSDGSVILEVDKADLPMLREWMEDNK